MFVLIDEKAAPQPWNKGKLIGQKPPLKLAEIWTVRTQLRIAGKTRNVSMKMRHRGVEIRVAREAPWGRVWARRAG
jgi:hypothetical protein